MSFYLFARSLCTLVLKMKGYRISGLENIPKEGPGIIACNHLSLWDPVIVGCAVPREIIFLAKEELYGIPVVGRIFRSLLTIPVKRGQGDIGAIRKALAALKEGKLLGVFPEGTRSKTGDIQEAMAGVILIMEKSKTPIYPVKIYHSKGLIFQKRGSAGIIFGKPIYPDQLSAPEGVENRRSWLANELMGKVNKM